MNSHAGFREYLCRFPRLLFYWVQFQWNKWFICLLRLFYFFLISNETFHYILKQKNETTYCFLCKQNLITQCFTISHVYSCQHNIIVKPEFWVFKIQRLYILKKERSVFALMFNLNAHTILKYLRFLILNRMQGRRKHFDIGAASVRDNAISHCWQKHKLLILCMFYYKICLFLK